MEPLDILEAARADFSERLTAVGPDQWDFPSLCGDWTVRDLALHLVRGNTMAALLLAATSRDDTIAAMRAIEAGDLVAQFDDSADRQAAAFAEPGAFECLCHHPVGDMPGTQLFGFRVCDMGLHAWDLSRAIGADDRLRPEVVEVAWESLSPMAPIIGETGVFGTGPSGSVPDDASLQVRVLDLSGRRP